MGRFHIQLGKLAQYEPNVVAGASSPQRVKVGAPGALYVVARVSEFNGVWCAARRFCRSSRLARVQRASDPLPCQTGLMAAYFVAQYVVNDLELYREYRKGAGPSIQAAGAELVIFDAAAETVEGSPPGPQTVVLKFEDTAAAKAWYGSEEYQAVVGKRLEATAGFAVISQSMNAG